MAERTRRIVVTQPRTPLGRAVRAALASRPDVDQVRGVDTSGSGPRMGDPEIDSIAFVPDHRPFAEYLEKEGIDTVVQCGLVPDRAGLESGATEADVITTMCLGAAIAQRGSPVRSWVLASSTAIYPIGAHTALMQVERQPVHYAEESLAASIAEAEDYARDVAHRLPHVNVAILRLQHLAGPEIRDPLAGLFKGRVVPTPIGFDPSIQLLHLEDAADAIAFAAEHQQAGVYNVASAGMIHWLDAVRAADRAPFPVLPISLSLIQPVLERLDVPCAPVDLLDVMRFGHAVDISKLLAAGWAPRKDQNAILAELGRVGVEGEEEA